MRLPLLALLVGTALASPNQQPLSTTLTLSLPPSPGLPNPNALPPSTRASLSSLGVLLTAPLSTHNTFVFRNVTAGSYLADIACATHAFAPLRVDVDIDGVKAWETYRGNEWGNRGEGSPLTGDGVVEVRVLGGKGYFSERSKCLCLPASPFPCFVWCGVCADDDGDSQRLCDPPEPDDPAGAVQSGDYVWDAVFG